MLGKTLILGLISAGAAGAIVYYGTAPQGSEALEAYLQNGVKAENRVAAERKTIEPRMPTVRKSDEDDGRQELASAGWNTGSNTTDGDNIAGGENESEMLEEATTSSNSGPQKQTRWLDQYLKNNKSADVEDKPESSNDDVNKAAAGGASSAANSYVVTEAADPQGTKESVTDSRTFRIEDGKLVEVKTDNATDAAIKDIAKDTAKDGAPSLKDIIKTDKEETETQAEARVDDKAEGAPYKFTRDKANTAADSTPLLSTVMREAAEIKKAELRDQAYFEITEYALSEGRYDSARLAHDKIEQEELAYTAKSRIAVAFAQNGEPTKAFKVIGEVKEAELRDFMRLQVIEALIAPQRLPEAWQENRN